MHDYDILSCSYHLKQISEQGFTLLKKVVDTETVQQLLTLIQKYNLEFPKPQSAVIPYLNRGHEVIYNLQNKDVYFIKTNFNHSLLRAILMGALNDTWYKQIPQDKPNYILRSMLARSGGPEALPLHIDSFIPGHGSYPWSLQASFVLEDQFPENGCTVVVPGSHLLNRYADQKTDIINAIPIISKAGDILIWDSRLFHGTTGNASGKSRWAFISTYGRWWLKQNFDMPRSLPQEIFQQLTDEEKSVLGFCSSPPKDEFERIDIKGGYELLLAGQGLISEFLSF